MGPMMKNRWMWKTLRMMMTHPNSMVKSIYWWAHNFILFSEKNMSIGYTPIFSYKYMGPSTKCATSKSSGTGCNR